MHGRTGKRLVVVFNQTRSHITRVEYRCFRRFTQTIVTVRQRVREGPQHHAVVAEERLYPADRLRLIIIEPVRRIGRLHDSWHRQVRFELFRTTTWAGAWPTAAMRS